MAKKTKTRWAIAKRVADTLCRLLADCTERCEVAGSIRRREVLVGDIELLVIPRYRPDLFGGAGQSMLDPALNALVHCKRLERVRGGDKFKTYKDVDLGLQVDIFVATDESWPASLAIRTGPALFSKKLVTQQSQGGLLPDRHSLQVSTGRVYRDRIVDEGTILSEGVHVPISSERELLELCACGWIEPESRAGWIERRSVRRGYQTGNRRPV